jgi:5'-nucleotidase
MPRPLILLSNDDGIHAEGLRALESALSSLGTVITVAPETEQSASSHAITLSRPLRLRRYESHRYAVDGTPADCVYVGLHHREVLPRRPDLVVSGINHGLNLGSDVFYSGTVAAAREGALRGIPAIAVSLARNGDRGYAGALANKLATLMLSRSSRKNGRVPILLNVNVPPGNVRGVRATRLGQRLYEELVEMRTDPRGQQYLWIGGPNVYHPPSEGTDTAAYEDGYASVTPLTTELFHTDDFPAVAEMVAATYAPSQPAASKRLRARSASTAPRKTTRRKPRTS